MSRSFPFTIGSPLKMRRKLTAKTHQHAHADTHQPAFFYIWSNDIDECRLVRFHHVDAFSVMLHGFFKCWIFGHLAFHSCTTVACLPPIRGLEKCRVIGHNPHFSNLCSLSCLNPKVLPKGILFSACDWWKAINCGTSHIDSSEAVVYEIPLGLLGFAS